MTPPPALIIFYYLVAGGCYAYTEDLLRLRNSWPGSGGQLYPQLSQVTSPLSYQAWEDRLQHHPDAVFTCYILEGLQTGFRIGLSPGTCFQSAQSNMQSAREHPQIIDDYLLKESTAGRILGPFFTCYAKYSHK